MNIKEKTVKGFLGLGIYKGIGQAFTWVLFIMLARILDPEDFGLMALSIFFINFFNFISEFGLSSALIQKEDLDDDEINSSFWFVVLFNGAMYVFTFILSYPIGMFYNNEKLAILIQVLGINFIISSFRIIPLCLLAKQLEFVKGAKAEFYSNVVSSILMYFLALLGFGVWSLIAGSILQNIFSTALMYYYCPWWPRPVFQFHKIKKMLSFGMSVNASKILLYLSDNSDNLIVGKVLGEKSLGFYNMSFVLGTMPIKKTGAIIYHIIFPVFSQLQNDGAMLRRYFLKTNKYIALFAFPATIGLLMISDSFVAVALGEKWTPMVLPLKILCGIGVMKSMSITLTPLLYSKWKANIILKYSLFSALTLPMAFYAGTEFGIAGVAIAWVVVYPFIFFPLLRLALKEVTISIYDYAANLGHAVIGTICMVATVALFQYNASTNDYVQLIGSCFVGVLSYSLVLFFISKETIVEFKNTLFSLRKREIRT
jgi:O-antigen/teichoic acid export membrane protein